MRKYYGSNNHAITIRSAVVDIINNVFKNNNFEDHTHRCVCFWCSCCSSFLCSLRVVLRWSCYFFSHPRWLCLFFFDMMSPPCWLVLMLVMLAHGHVGLAHAVCVHVCFSEVCWVSGVCIFPRLLFFPTTSPTLGCDDRPTELVRSTCRILINSRFNRNIQT